MIIIIIIMTITICVLQEQREKGSNNNMFSLYLLHIQMPYKINNKQQLSFCLFGCLDMYFFFLLQHFGAKRICKNYHQHVFLLYKRTKVNKNMTPFMKLLLIILKTTTTTTITIKMMVMEVKINNKNYKPVIGVSGCV